MSFSFIQHKHVEPMLMAYDRPSPKFLSFLAKHYCLTESVPQVWSALSPSASHSSSLISKLFLKQNRMTSSVNGLLCLKHRLTSGDPSKLTAPLSNSPLAFCVYSYCHSTTHAGYIETLPPSSSRLILCSLLDLEVIILRICVKHLKLKIGL